MSQRPTVREIISHNNFDFLRFFLSALVVFSHSFPLLYGSKDWEPLYRLTQRQVESGAVAVDGFFVISGFLIAQSWMRGRGLWDFAKKRFLRIYPGFAMALLFCILVVGPLGGVNLATYFRDPVTYKFFWAPLLLWNGPLDLPAAFVHNPFPAAVNGSLWTIPYELKCYAMVAVLGLLGLYQRREAVLVLFLAVFAFYNLEPYLHLRHFHGLLDRDYLPRLVTFYLAGMVAYFYRDKLPHSRWLVAISFLALVLTFRSGLSVTLPIFGSYLLLYVAFSKALRLENFGRRGDISYGVYLYAFPVQQLLVHRWHNDLTPLTLFLLALPCTCVLATLSWYLVEQPSLKRKNHVQQNEVSLGQARIENQAVTTGLHRELMEFPRLDFLDGLRALAAIYVMLYHARLTVFYAHRQPDRLEGMLIRWLDFGHFAVDLFIVLSGFCLMIPIVRGNGVLAGGVASFFKKRARRILPTYYAALVISVVFATTVLNHRIGTIWDLSLPVTRMGFVAHMLLLQNIHRSMEINSVFWSIAVECQIYLFFPLIVLAWKAIGWQKTAVATIAISLIASIWLQHTWLQGLTAHYLALFTFGMLGSTLSFSAMPVASRHRINIPWKGVSLTLFVLLVIICSFFPGWVSQYIIFVDLLVGLCATAFIVAMNCDTKNPLNRVLRSKPLVFIGSFSYSLYLVHLPLLQVLWQFGLFPLHVSNLEKLMLLCLCGGALVVPIAYLFFLAFERPFISKRQISTSAVLATSGALSPAP